MGKGLPHHMYVGFRAHRPPKKLSTNRLEDMPMFLLKAVTMALLCLSCAGGAGEDIG